ncbi:MAG: terminase large subunit domain-containing protein [Bryobacteraceae bacterium]
MLSADLRSALDPVHFCGERLQLALDPWQCALLRRRGLRELVNVTRQGGKSTCTAAAVLHECCFVPGSKTIVISPSQRQSDLLLERVKELAERARLPVRPLGGEGSGLTAPSGTFVALPASEATTRGFSGCTWLIVDEAARVPDALFHSSRAYLATTNGRTWLLSTPFGRRGFFHREHESGRWRITKIPAVECPRISPEFLAEQQLSLPAAWFRQEYECEFTSVEDGLFDHDLVLQAVTSEVEPLCL